MSDSIPKNQVEVLEFIKKGKIKDGILKMNTLWSADKKGKFRYWKLFIGIENMKKKEMVSVTKDMIEEREWDFSADYAGVYWTKSGVEGTENPIISEKTYVEKGKSVKSNNFTTPLTQAILEARSDYNFKIRKGHLPDKELLNMPGKKIKFEKLFEQDFRGTYPWRVFAMALHDFAKKENKKKITYPAYVQPKLDGTLFIVVAHPKLPTIFLKGIGNAHIDAYSRGRETYEGQNHILEELYPVLINYPGLHLVGELWKKGFGLQDISGFSRRQLDSKIKSEAVKMNFNIFDCFYLDKDMGFAERLSLLEDIMTDLKKKKFIKLIETDEVESEKDLMSRYKSFLDEGYEGAVVRNKDSPYEVGINKEIRSYETLKLKPRPDAEFPVINFKDGNGKEKGSVIWICAESDDGVSKRLKLSGKDPLPELSDRLSFAVTPNMDYDQRKKIFKKLEADPKFFEKNIFGQLLTISYSILSDDFLPQQPKALRFRDQHITELIIN